MIINALKNILKKINSKRLSTFVLNTHIDFKLKKKLYLFDNGEDLILNEIKRKSWEFGSIEIWKNLINKIKFNTIIDAGSYSGVYGLIAYSEKTDHPKIMFIEANPFVFSRLNINLKLNNIPFNYARWCSLSDSKASENKFFVRFGAGSLSTIGSLIKNEKVNYQVTCPNLNINQLLKDVKYPLLMKIDIEGMEYSIIKNLVRIKEKIFCLCEILDEDNFKLIKSCLDKSEWSIFHISEYNKKLNKVKKFIKTNNSRNFIIVNNKYINELDSLNV